MKEIDYLRESRLIAIETMLAHVYNVTMRLACADESAIKAAEDDAMSQAATNTVTGAEKLTPVQRDHLASEATVSLYRLFDIARQMR